jgi:uncharacterized protein (TIGR02284 family)
MRIQTLQTLDQSTIDGLNRLVTANDGSCALFAEAARLVHDGSLRSHFARYADTRAANATELRSYLRRTGAEPSEGPNMVDSLHALWLQARSHVSGGSGRTILAELERAEERLVGAYSRVLRATAGSPLTSVLNRQLRGVKLDHDTIRELLDGSKGQ